MSADFGQTIAAAYAADGPTVDLGRGVHEGELDPEAVVQIPLRMMNRHGLVAGATGTGKTVTLQTIAEQLSAAGVAVFAADVKGDVSGVGVPGEPRRARREAHDASSACRSSRPAFPVAVPVARRPRPGRARPRDRQRLRPAAAREDPRRPTRRRRRASRSSSTTPTRRACRCSTSRDLRALLTFLESDAGKAELEGIGGLASSTVGVLLRALVGLEDGGGSEFFGEPQLDIDDLLAHAAATAGA